MAAKAGEFLDEKGDDPRDDWGGNAGARKPHVRLRVPQIRNVVPLAREVKQRLPRGGDRRVVEKLPTLADRAGRLQTGPRQRGIDGADGYGVYGLGRITYSWACIFVSIGVNKRDPAIQYSLVNVSRTSVCVSAKPFFFPRF